MRFEATRSYADRLDNEDPLASYRNRFHIPRHDETKMKLYFCGNSLGLQPKSTHRYIDEILENWAHKGVEGHFEGSHPWFPYHEFVSEQLAQLLGAQPVEVVAMNSLTVNLHLMLVSFFRPMDQRQKILIEKHAFPSDRYAVVSQLKYHGLDPEQALIEVGPRQGEATIRHTDLLQIIERQGKDIALILLPGVQYYSGQAFDMEAITDAGHRQGCIVGFDLAHAAGNLLLELHDWQVDFAVWCSYKYLNGGPGAVGGCFVHERYARRFDLPRFAGWWGHDKTTRFQMPDEFNVLGGAEGWQISNPQILSLAPLLASLDLFKQAGMVSLRDKSDLLTRYLEHLLTEQCGKILTVLTPKLQSERGAQLSVTLGTDIDGKAIHHQLSEKGVVCDWREPDVLRISPVPFYNRFTEVFDFVEMLKSSILP